MTNTNKIFLGTITLGKTVIVADPCYSKKSRWVLHLDVNPGVWDVYSVPRFRELITIREYANDNGKWEFIGRVAVDSGQAGIYDLHHYQDNKIVNNYQFSPIDPDIIQYLQDHETLWYSVNCDITLHSEPRAGILPFGCVSQSGDGDGVYAVYVIKNNGKVEGVKVHFK